MKKKQKPKQTKRMPCLPRRALLTKGHADHHPKPSEHVIADYLSARYAELTVFVWSTLRTTSTQSMCTMSTTAAERRGHRISTNPTMPSDHTLRHIQMKWGVKEWIANVEFEL